jgi:hypothetical protein
LRKLREGGFEGQILDVVRDKSVEAVCASLDYAMAAVDACGMLSADGRNYSDDEPQMDRQQVEGNIRKRRAGY